MPIDGSALLYEGPSPVNGAPIVAIVTGLSGDSCNPKTGTLAQLYVLLAEEHPLAAAKVGADVAICGTCPFKPSAGGGCYETIVHAPRAVWESYRAGRYARRSPVDVNRQLRATGRGIRLGAYGDPALLPIWLLADLTADVDHTGYTHQWADVDPSYSRYLMASVQSAAGAKAAAELGYRYFRVRAPEQPVAAGEISCPASAEAGHKASCIDCGFCDGRREWPAVDRRPNIVIVAHGSPAAKALRTIRLLEVQ